MIYSQLVTLKVPIKAGGKKKKNEPKKYLSINLFIIIRNSILIGMSEAIMNELTRKPKCE